jgi:hypothetical protein
MPASASGGSLVKCEACGSTFIVPSSLTPEPTLGNLLLGADFTNPTIPGWKVYDRENPVEFGEQDGIPEYRVILPLEPEHRTTWLIATPGILDDFDACVSLRFLAGDAENYFAGFDLRCSEEGYYEMMIDSGGRFRLCWFDKHTYGGDLVKWCFQPALKKGLEERNTIRVLMRGPKIRIYLNGVFSFSLHDERFSAGNLRLLAAPFDKEMRLAVSNLQIREQHLA